MSFPDFYEPSSPTPREPSPVDRLVDWVGGAGAWWASSFLFHMFLMIALTVAGSKYLVKEEVATAPTLEEADVPPQVSAEQPDDLERFEMSTTPMNPNELNPENLDKDPGPVVEEVKAVYYDDNPVFTEQQGAKEGGGRPNTGNEQQLGGLGGFSVSAPTPGIAIERGGGVGSGEGTGVNPGFGGAGVGFGTRGTGHRDAMVGGFGGTRKSERAVAAALLWLSRHQCADGRWSFHDYHKSCTDKTCQTLKEAQSHSDLAATAMGLLPFMAAGQTHNASGPYREPVFRGLEWIMRQQRSQGELMPPRRDANESEGHYSHALATIALCEAYGLTKDSTVRQHAERAVQYIQSAQHGEGGWRYSPGEDGDTSVTGWMVMALKSGQMAGLPVEPKTMDKARNFLKSVSRGGRSGLFCYKSSMPPNNRMTAAGLLCSQYLGIKRHEPQMLEGIGHLMANLPNGSQPDLYYWYYATQVLHNAPGPEWDAWNRRMRRILIESQVQEGCARGSWDPFLPTPDTYGAHGTRIWQTSLSALILEVYYRYLPLYQMEGSAPATQPIIILDK